MTQPVIGLGGGRGNAVVPVVPGQATLGGPWIPVTAGTYNAKPGEQKFLVDSTGGPATIVLAAPLVDNQIIAVKDRFGQAASGGTIVVKPPGTTTKIENSAVPGTYVTAAQGGALIDTPNAPCAQWQYIKSIDTLVEVV